MKVLLRQIAPRRVETLLFCLLRGNIQYVLLSFIAMEFLLRWTDRTKLTVKLKLIPCQEKQWQDFAIIAVLDILKS